MEKIKDKNNDEQTKNKEFEKYFWKNFRRSTKSVFISTPIITSAILINLGLFRKNKWNALLKKSNFPMIKKYTFCVFLGLSFLEVLGSFSIYGLVGNNLSSKEMKENYLKQFSEKN